MLRPILLTEHLSVSVSVSQYNRMFTHTTDQHNLCEKHVIWLDFSLIMIKVAALHAMKEEGGVEV